MSYADDNENEIKHFCPYCGELYYDQSYLSGPCPNCANADGDWHDYAVNYLDTSPSFGV